MYVCVCVVVVLGKGSCQLRTGFCSHAHICSHVHYVHRPHPSKPEMMCTLSSDRLMHADASVVFI